MKSFVSFSFCVCLASLAVPAQTSSAVPSVPEKGIVIEADTVPAPDVPALTQPSATALPAAVAPRLDAFPANGGSYMVERGIMPAAVNPAATRMPVFAFVPGVADIVSWGSGGVYASGSRENLPGLMGIESGALNFRQQIGAFTLTMFGSAVKYGYFRGLSTSYGFGGELSYRINDNLGITLFGAYYSPAGISQAAMMGNVNVSTFGGYVDWRFHEHWGVKVGARSYRSVAYGGRWETLPVVTPYYRTSGGAEFGVDLGGILYEVVRNASGKKWGGYGNPTIGRPDFGPPPIRPHE